MQEQEREQSMAPAESRTETIREDVDIHMERNEQSWQAKGRRKKKDIFWGVLLLLGAAALLLNKLEVGIFVEIGVRNICFSVLLAVILAEGLFKKNFGQILFSLAFLVIVNDELLGLEAITPWPVLGAALLGSIGLRMLFPKFENSGCFGGKGHGRKNVSEESREGGTIRYENAFGESVKYLTGEVEAVSVETSFGQIQLYFTDAELKDNRAQVQAEVSFGSAILYVPADWKIVMNVDTAFGSATIKGKGCAEGENTLYIGGDVSFGELRVQYI